MQLGTTGHCRFQVAHRRRNSSLESPKTTTSNPSIKSCRNLYWASASRDSKRDPRQISALSCVIRTPQLWNHRTSPRGKPLLRRIRKVPAMCSLREIVGEDRTVATHGAHNNEGRRLRFAMVTM